MTASQRFGRFAVRFRVPQFFSPRMVRITPAETSSKEGKQCPRIDTYNLWNKSKSVGLMSGLYGAWGNTPHSYLLGKSVTNVPKCGRALSWKMCGPSPSKSGRVCTFFCAIFVSSYDGTQLSHLFHIELYLSWWFLGNHKQRSSFAWTLIALVEIFWVAGRLDFCTRLSAISNPVQSL